MHIGLQKAEFFADGGEHRLFGSYNEALEWCENQLLTHHEVGAASTPSFENWLMAEFGGATDISRIVPFLERHELEIGGFLFRQGELADFPIVLNSPCGSHQALPTCSGAGPFCPRDARSFDAPLPVGLWRPPWRKLLSNHCYATSRRLPAGCRFL